MNSIATRRFWDLFNALSPGIQKLAVKSYALWLRDPHHPSLHFRRLQGSKDRFSVRGRRRNHRHVSQIHQHALSGTGIRGDLLEERRELMDAWGRYALDRQDASGRCSHSGETHNVSGRERYD